MDKLDFEETKLLTNQTEIEIEDETNIGENNLRDSTSNTISSLQPLSSSSSLSSQSSLPKSDDGTFKWIRFHRFLSQNWYLNYLLPGIVLISIIVLMYFCRGYAKKLLIWIEHQNSWLIFSIFMFMFVIVSFPITVGYLILMITSGYLFGVIKGLLTVILGANLGVAIAHNIIKSIQGKLPIHRLIKSDTGRAILRVIAGPRAFKVVMFTRLTPIPFGLQNTIFGVSSVNPRTYHTATLIGLLPAQIINVYLGSTLRSMHDVLNSHQTAFTGYVIFSIEMLIAVLLMLWVIQKAKSELSQTLLSDIGSECKVIIDVET